MASSIADKWTIFDKLIQNLRYRKVVGLIPYGTLADLGCGDGDFLQYLVNKGRVASGYGIDRKIKCSTDTKHNLILKEGDLNKEIPLGNESVDSVTALAVIEHLHEPEVLVREIYRVLKPNGICILTTPSPAAKPVLEFLAFKLKIISEQDIKDHKRYFNKKELQHLFSQFSESVKIDNFQFGFNTIIIAKKPATIS